MMVAREVLRARERSQGIEFIFKASYDKANRTAAGSYRGPGIERGLRILREVGAVTGLPLLTDIHQVWEAAPAANVCQWLQVPAFLCRQTDLIAAAAKTGRNVNLKKGQFMSAAAMLQQREKAGRINTSITERGTFFGYSDLVVDMRGIAEMRAAGVDVIFDVTHSMQRPGAGGDKRFYMDVARAAIAAGATGLYCEVHPDPDNALCDRDVMLSFAEFRGLVDEVKKP